MFESKTVTVGSFANGETFSIPVFHCQGAQPDDAPSVYIQANIHGAEVQGNAVIYQLLERLNQERPLGNITLVPYANPIGSNLKMGEYTYGRFDPTTGNNWNRAYYYDMHFLPGFIKKHRASDTSTIRREFKSQLISQVKQRLENSTYNISLPEKIALQLQIMAHQADIVLDLHTGPSSSKHLYVPEYSRDSARYFDIPHHLLIPNEFAGALDEACFCPWWELSNALINSGRDDFSLEDHFEAFTVELGSHEQINLDDALDDAKSLLSYLSHKNVFSGDNYRPKEMDRHACYLKDYKTFYLPEGGLVEYVAQLGMPLEKGEVIARVLNLRAEKNKLVELTAPEAGIPILHYSSATAHSGAELYKFFVNYFEL